ncbi:MAG: hypothetical protein C4570_07310 [Ammonifex sp.]|nr:MAG: hypothetical protein C4570_07310 [Ammonifex sp.]
MVILTMENAAEFVRRVKDYGERSSCDPECLNMTIQDYSVGEQPGPVWMEVCVKEVGNIARGEEIAEVWLFIRFGKDWQEPGWSVIDRPVEWVYEHRRGANEYLQKHAAEAQRLSLCKIGRQVRITKTNSPHYGKTGTTRRFQSPASPDGGEEYMYEVVLRVPEEDYPKYASQKNFNGYITPWFFNDDLEFI